MSTDIEKGKRWSDEVASQLEVSSLGIFCLTPENLSEPWLHFEAGAVAKQRSESRPMTFLVGLDKSDARPPDGRSANRVVPKLLAATEDVS
jgi:hypothetical protein